MLFVLLNCEEAKSVSKMWRFIRHQLIVREGELCCTPMTVQNPLFLSQKWLNKLMPTFLFIHNGMLLMFAYKKDITREWLKGSDSEDSVKTLGPCDYKVSAQGDPI